jgi:predicted lipoprotein with Yx(FWY)xxD motif
VTPCCLRGVVAIRALAAAVVVSASLLVGCGGGETTSPEAGGPASPAGEVTPSDPTTPPSSTPARGSTRGTVVRTSDSQFGEILFDGVGQAIYLFEKEKTSKSECYGSCAEAWPPVLTRDAPVAAAGARADALGTTSRTNGTTQVTYAGHPLYYYAHEGRDEVRCHNVREFGGLWLVVTPSGKAAPHS